MMNFNGVLDLTGTLVLKEKVLVGGVEALVELPAPGTPSHGTAPPVALPPPPAPPTDPGTTVWVVSSVNKTVKAGTRAIVTGGTVMQGNVPTWPGTVQPSKRNPDVRIERVAICVVGDEAVVQASGALVTFTASGQG